MSLLDHPTSLDHLPPQAEPRPVAAPLLATEPVPTLPPPLRRPSPAATRAVVAATTADDGDDDDTATPKAHPSTIGWSIHVAIALGIGLLTSWSSLMGAMEGTVPLRNALVQLVAVSTVALLGVTFVSALYRTFSERAELVTGPELATAPAGDGTGGHHGTEA